MKFLKYTVFLVLFAFIGRQAHAIPLAENATSDLSNDILDIDLTPVGSSSTSTPIGSSTSTPVATQSNESTVSSSQTPSATASSSTTPSPALKSVTDQPEEKSSTSTIDPLEISTPKPVITHVGVPFIVDMNLLRSNQTGGGKNTALDLGILGGLIRVNMDRRTNPATGLRTGPISVSIFGQKIYGNRKRRSSNMMTLVAQ